MNKEPTKSEGFDLPCTEGDEGNPDLNTICLFTHESNPSFLVVHVDISSLRTKSACVLLGGEGMGRAGTLLDSPHGLGGHPKTPKPLPATKKFPQKSFRILFVSEATGATSGATAILVSWS